MRCHPKPLVLILWVMPPQDEFLFLHYIPAIEMRKKSKGVRADFIGQKNNSYVEKKMNNIQPSEVPKTSSNVSRTRGCGQSKNIGQENISTESNFKNNNISDTYPNQKSNHKAVECISKEQNKNVSNEGSTRQEINRPDSVRPRKSVVKKGSAIRSLFEDPAFANNTGPFDYRMNASFGETEAELNEKRPAAKTKLCDVKNNERGSQAGEQSESSKSKTNGDDIKSREHGNIICFAVSFNDKFVDYECKPSCAIHDVKIDLVKQYRVDIDSQFLRLNKRVIKDGTVLSNGIKNGDVLRLNKV
mmetsp:Transcript_7444/g.10955  ORF Transcript_7444/g.10955 Transcript_7444/m.10955 type:complete len:302 (+) Transcript_7444:398-1303(+)